MANNNKTYRIRTTVGRESDSFLDIHLDQDYDSLEILSLKISDKDVYKLHNSDYGVVVGRVLANGNFGVPNAKISVFISADTQNSDMEILNLYPYTSTSTRNDDDIRYNLLPDRSVRDCHKAVGTFPHKTYVLDNDALIEVFDKYYVYTTRTNAAGDYMICGVPTGMQTIHMDLDLSDCGILSQRPRDFVYKGYTIEQFENPNQFKKDSNLDSLSQIFTQNQPVYVQPFWGNEDNGEEIGITRADIEISFKFEPTCVFMGSAISDNASNGISKKCVPTNTMGLMEELTAGEGTIEMIRKTPEGNVEEFSIKGNELINGNGVWCYQIPMNLDYMMTDEYGNMVPTDDPEKGIPTRTRVRFRASLSDMGENTQSFYRAKYLIPNNPSVDEETVDYNFGTHTEERSYRDLFWNGVYTVKSYIPRFQKSKRWRNERFSGIKACNYYGNNNPIPYNNMRIKLPFMFTVLCIFVKLFLKLVSLTNRILSSLVNIMAGVAEFLAISIFGPLLLDPITEIIVYIIFGESMLDVINGLIVKGVSDTSKDWGVHCVFIGDGLCPEMEGWYFAPSCGTGISKSFSGVSDTMMTNTWYAATGDGDDMETDKDETKNTMKTTDFVDQTSIDNQNTTSTEKESVCLTRDVDYLLNCFEMNLAQEYRVIKFDFYNDWINGVIYFPRWMRKVKKKKRYKLSLKNGITSYYKEKVLGCLNAPNSRVKKTINYTQQCSLTYKQAQNAPWTEVITPPACWESKLKLEKIVPSKCHKKPGMRQSPIFGKKNGLVREETTMLGQYVYYLKPCEFNDDNKGKTRTLLFATDIVLLGTLNDCDENGIPQAFKYLSSTSYIMPTNLALTTLDDEAYIYAGKDGTICSGNVAKKEQSVSSANTESSALRVRNDYINAYCAYTKSESDSYIYENNDDPIPITEAAGITWNYAGPGQEDIPIGKDLESPFEYMNRIFGIIDDKQRKTLQELLYYPGGHFLGLSCVNSDSNIKSCVNLKRICEVGATMSQRREALYDFVYGNNDPKKGEPKYKYYVPTGLISDVDIESASFRSMFATLNHNKLVATERNETTGYKKYNFRFLRPDGFDGSLKKMVHQTESPYNAIVSGYVRDNTTLFEELFHGLWEQPEDYDPYEIDNTQRRTVENGVNDYYMFRMGLNSFKTAEQKKHFLRKEGNGYILPQYENSFYFYFGLKDGSTALDEFRKQFFSECESNNVTRTPEVAVQETIYKNLTGKATIIIDNMVATYTVKIVDKKNKKECVFQTDNDEFVLPYEACRDFKIIVGCEYTITVTDSLDQTVEKTFTFGASAVKADYEVVNFRRENLSTKTASTSAREGGYVKINNIVRVLNDEQRIDDGKINFEFYYVDSKGNESLHPEGMGAPTHYNDMDGQTWYLYFPKMVGTYNVYVKYEELNEAVAVFTIKLDDNSRINLYYSCDYLSYKPTFDKITPTDRLITKCCYPLTGGTGNPLTDGLRKVSMDDWQTNSVDTFGGSTNIKWLMRHSFYRQTGDNTLRYDNHIYSDGDSNIAIFGHPESGNTLIGNGGVLSVSTNKYRDDYGDYLGYNIDDSYVYYPTAYWNGTEEAPVTNYRRVFDAMAYSDDGRAAANVLKNVIITGYSYDFSEKQVTLRYTGSDTDNVTELEEKHGAIVVFENGAKLFCVVTGSSTMTGHSDYNIYPSTPSPEILEMASVYPTLQIPVVYKPFRVDMSAATWNIQTLKLKTSIGETYVTKELLPLSYKTEGDIYNGLTFNNCFRERIGATGPYTTYLNFKSGPYSERFWDGLKPGNVEHEVRNYLPELDTKEDYKPKRPLQFGHGKTIDEYNWPVNNKNIDKIDFDDEHEAKSGWPTRNVIWPFGREIVVASSKVEKVDKIEYAIEEGVPTGFDGASSQVYTGRYPNKSIDLAIAKDSCSMDVFLGTPKIKVTDAKKGLNGPWYVYSDSLVPPMVDGTIISTGTPGYMELRVVEKPLFDTGDGPIYVSEKDESDRDTKKFYYGVYNGNTKNDLPGKTVTVEVTVKVDKHGKEKEEKEEYSFSITQDNGAQVKKTIKVLSDFPSGFTVGDVVLENLKGRRIKVDPPNYADDPEAKLFFPDSLSATGKNQLTTGEILLRSSGITLAHQYSLRGPYKRDINKIEKAFLDGVLISGVSTPNTTGQLIVPSARTGQFYSQYQTLIARYIKPVASDGRNMNRMVLYKLWPIEDLQIMYPASIGGIEPYVQGSNEASYNKDAQQVQITVATNVSFGVIVCKGVLVSDTGGTEHVEIVLDSQGHPEQPDWITIIGGNDNDTDTRSKNPEFNVEYNDDGNIRVDDGPKFDKLYDSTINSITLSLERSSEDRYAVIYFECTDEDVNLVEEVTVIDPVTGEPVTEWKAKSNLVWKTIIKQSKEEEPPPSSGPTEATSGDD